MLCAQSHMCHGTRHARAGQTMIWRRGVIDRVVTDAPVKAVGTKVVLRPKVDRCALAVDRCPHDDAIIFVGMPAVIVGRIRTAEPVFGPFNSCVDHLEVQDCVHASQHGLVFDPCQIYPAGWPPASSSPIACMSKRLRSRRGSVDGMDAVGRGHPCHQQSPNEANYRECPLPIHSTPSRRAAFLSKVFRAAAPALRAAWRIIRSENPNPFPSYC